jgi:hypothetical protein
VNQPRPGTKELARDNQLRRRVHDFAAQHPHRRRHAETAAARLFIEDVRVTGWHVQIRLRIALDPATGTDRLTKPKVQTVVTTPRPVLSQDRLRSVSDLPRPHEKIGAVRHHPDRRITAANHPYWRVAISISRVSARRWKSSAVQLVTMPPFVQV